MATYLSAPPVYLYTLNDTPTPPPADPKAHGRVVPIHSATPPFERKFLLRSLHCKDCQLERRQHDVCVLLATYNLSLDSSTSCSATARSFSFLAPLSLEMLASSASLYVGCRLRAERGANREQSGIGIEMLTSSNRVSFGMSCNRSPLPERVLHNE